MINIDALAEAYYAKHDPAMQDDMIRCAWCNRWIDIDDAEERLGDYICTECAEEYDREEEEEYEI